MKWYKAEEHYPTGEDCIIRLQNKHNPDIFVFVVASWNFTHKKWMFLSMEAYNKNYYCEPTHFAIIEPVPVDKLQ